ncbi:Transcriptional regulator, CadC [Minicystis rosea]|nr:Transcriptional regulator, CadC [Minicystis rosea]
MLVDGFSTMALHSTARGTRHRPLHRGKRLTITAALLAGLMRLATPREAWGAPPGEAPLDPQIASLEERLGTRIGKLEKREKDIWDKLSALSGLLSGAVVAFIGFYATNIYNRRQREAEVSRKNHEIRISEAQAIEKLIPHLAKEDTKAAALIAIATLGNDDLAVKLAATFPGRGSTVALATIVANDATPAAELATQTMKTDVMTALAAADAQPRLESVSPAGAEAARLGAPAKPLDITKDVIRRAARATVLWVDDRPSSNMHVRRALEAVGLGIVPAATTEEALDLLAARPFDVVISDMRRPPDDRAGYTLLARMRERGDATPFVIYAGAAAAEHREEATQKGALGSTNRPRELVDLVLSALPPSPPAAAG